MRNQNNAGITLPKDLADNFPTSLVSAIAHLQVAHEMLDQQTGALQHLSDPMRDRIYGRITSIMGDLNLINNECCEMLFDIFAKTIEGLPLRKSLML